MVSLVEMFDAATVERLAGPWVHHRGVAYLRDRRVESPSARDGRLDATVRGTMPYAVALWADRNKPRWSCTCPAAEDGSFCKHCVAAALSLTAGGGPPASEPAVGTSRPRGPDFDGGSESDTGQELADFVKGLAPERLAEIVLDRAESDWRLRERLLAEARAGRGAGIDLAGWRRRIDRAFTDRDFMDHGFVTYRDAAGWAESIDEVIDSLEDLRDAGHHDAAARLTEHAHRRADDAIDYVDDSDGWLSGIASRLADLHLSACESGSPDPVELAARLVELELSSELEGFHRCAQDYADVLGPTGLAAFHEHLSSRLPEAEPDTDGWSGEAFTLRQALVGWAQATGDPDALIAAHSRGGTTHHAALEIAQALDCAGRDDEAISWARRGMADTGRHGWNAGDLRDFLARKLRDRGETQAAIDLYWEAFAGHPSVSAYRRLVEEDHTEDWLARCRMTLQGALASLPESDPATREPRAAFGPLPPAVPAAAALVDILLYEGLADAAWEVATRHGCRRDLWLTLARARESDSPLDAIAVYEQASLAIIERKNAAQYESAVDLMVRVRRLADAAGEPDRFTSFLALVRTEHKAKRKLKSLLDAQGW